MGKRGVGVGTVLRNILGNVVLVELLLVFLFTTIFVRPTRLISLYKWNIRRMVEAFGLRVKVVGAERLAPGRPYLLMCNHISRFDHFILLGYLPGAMVGLEKIETLKMPAYGWAARRWGQVHVDRDDHASGLAACAEIERRFTRGSRVVIFPEGTRTRDGRLRLFKKGGFHIATGLSAEVVPLTLGGLYALAPRGSLLIRGGPVTLTVGEPLRPAGEGGEAREALAMAVRGAMLSTLDQAEGYDHPPFG